MADRHALLRCTAPMIADGISSALRAAGWTVATERDADVPVVVVIFVRTPNGVAEVRAARADDHIPIVALTETIDADLTADLVGAGATSIVWWDSPPEVLAAAADLARHGIATLPAPTLDWIARNGTNNASLTDAERTWLGHLAEGLTITELAPLAGYSERSLYRQLSQMYQRLGVSDRAAAIAEARRRHLL